MYIILLSHISTQKLEILIGDLSPITISEIWTINDYIEYQQWSKLHNIKLFNLKDEKKFKFTTPRNNVNLYLSYKMTEFSNCLFVYENYISKDNYLKGAIFNLRQLLIKEHYISNDLFTGIYTFELYKFICGARFACLDDSNRFVIHNGWELDYQLISNYNLRKKRLYNRFFSSLLQPKSNLTINNIPLHLANEPLFTFETIIKKIMYNCTIPFNKIFTSINIIYGMIEFRWRRYRRS